MYFIIHTKIIKIILVLLLIIGFVVPIICIEPVHAFSPAFILTDQELFEYDSMNQLDIYSFLARKKSYLATYKPEGSSEYASFIIYDAAQKYRINPKVILTMLQKEQSLIENTFTPSQYRLDWAMGYGMCDSCTRNTPGVEKFVGFQNQVYMAAKRLREYYEYPYQFRYRGGYMSQIDGHDIMILNQATAALYNYTPHLHGNQNFWKIWQRWFVKNIPNGSLVKLSHTPDIYLIKYGQKRQIANMSVLLSKYDQSKIIEVSPSDLEKYDDGPRIKFYDYSLLQDPSGSIYLLVDEDVLRPIASLDVFRKLGYNQEELIPITWEDIQDFHIGQEITLSTAYPQGILMKTDTAPEVYFVKDGKKHLLYDEALLHTTYRDFSMILVSQDELDTLLEGEPALFDDGELVKSHTDPGVYVLDEGLRRPIQNAKIFEKNGYSWDSIIEVSEPMLALYPLGSPID